MNPKTGQSPGGKILHVAIVSALIFSLSLLIYLIHLFMFKECIDNSRTFWDDGFAKYQNIAPKFPRTNEPLSKDEVMWFLHLSDLHISMLSSKASDNFVSFVDKILPAVNPSFVLATGDLTDGKLKGTIKTGQVLDEWKFYYNTLVSRNINSSFWIDLPGNHDKFDVADHRMNFFSQFGLQASHDEMLHTVSTAIGDVNILALDASPFPGLGRPLNFFGHLNEAQMNQAENTLNTLRSKNASSLRTIAICHYPICTMTFAKASSGASFSSLSRDFALYLPGHLHNLAFGWGDDLTIIHDTGFAEIEVGDLKAHGQFNLYSITDRNIFSWSSHQVEDKILLHIISPKSSRFLLSNHESNWIGRDEHGNLLIDLLLFPLDGVALDHLAITVNNVTKSIQSHELTLPFFTYSFEGTRKLSVGKSHSLMITATLIDNTTVSVGHSFSFKFENLFTTTTGSRILSFPFVSFFKRMYWISYFFILLLLGNFMYFSMPHERATKKSALLYLLYALLVLSPIAPLIVGKFVTDVAYWQMIFFMGMLNLAPGGYQWSFMADFPIFYSFYWGSFIAPLVLLLILEYLFANVIVLKVLKHIIFVIGMLQIGIIFFNYGLSSVILSPGIFWIFSLLFFFTIGNGFHIPKAIGVKGLHNE